VYARQARARLDGNKSAEIPHAEVRHGGHSILPAHVAQEPYNPILPGQSNPAERKLIWHGLCTVGREITIRAADLADRAELEDCMAELQAFEKTIESNRADPQSIRGLYIDGLLADCERTSGALIVADLNKRIVGFVCIFCRVKSDTTEQGREHAYLSDLIVLEPYRRQGIGSQLMQAAETYAISRGATRIRVGVLAGNSGALRLYRNMGYRESEIVLEKAVNL
jgi:ribosomal protein S18 acetylase RimI-like enzyme